MIILIQKLHSIKNSIIIKVWKMDILWKKVLVCYFWATGTTKRVAEEIAKSVDGDLFEIEPVEKYTSEDLDWTNKSSRSTVEMEDVNSRPSIVKK